MGSCHIEYIADLKGFAEDYASPAPIIPSSAILAAALSTIL